MNLQLGARTSDIFSLLQGPILGTAFGWDYIFRKVSWRTLDRTTFFSSFILFWFIRWYWGSKKIDGSRTQMYWSGQLTEPDETPDRSQYVVNTWWRELLSFRIRSSKPDRERYDNMGGI